MEIVDTNEFAKVLLAKMYWETIRQSFTPPKFRAIRYVMKIVPVSRYVFITTLYCIVQKFDSG